MVSCKCCNPSTLDTFGALAAPYLYMNLLMAHSAWAQRLLPVVLQPEISGPNFEYG